MHLIASPQPLALPSQVQCTLNVCGRGLSVQFKSERVLPPSRKQHMVVAWLAGALMSWLAESYRRCTFANQQAARVAHAKELEEKSRHLAAQEELATAREEVRKLPPPAAPASPPPTSRALQRARTAAIHGLLATAFSLLPLLSYFGPQGPVFGVPIFTFWDLMVMTQPQLCLHCTSESIWV